MKTRFIHSLVIAVLLLTGVFVGQTQPVHDVAAQVGGGVGNYDIAGNVIVHGTVTIADGNDLAASDDFTVSDDLAVGDDTTITGDLAVVGTVSASRQTTVTVTQGGTVAVTSGFVPLSGAYNTVGTSTVTGCSAGALTASAPFVVLYNAATNSVVFTDTSTLKLTGNITLGQFDTLTLKCDTGSGNWLMVGTANN